MFNIAHIYKKISQSFYTSFFIVNKTVLEL